MLVSVCISLDLVRSISHSITICVFIDFTVWRFGFRGWTIILLLSSGQSGGQSGGQWTVHPNVDSPVDSPVVGGRCCCAHAVTRHRRNTALAHEVDATVSVPPLHDGHTHSGGGCLTMNGSNQNKLFTVKLFHVRCSLVGPCESSSNALAACR